MAIVRKNISSNTTSSPVTLITKGSNVSGNISSILITNHDDSDSCVVKMQLNNGAGSPTIFVINETNMPARSSLILKDNIKFNSDHFSLQAVTNSDAEITIIIE